MPDFAPLTSTRRLSVINMEFAISPDGRRGFVVFLQNLWTYDLERGTELAKIITGRMSARLLSAAVAGVQTAASKSAARRDAERTGQSHYYYTEYTLRESNETIAVRPDSTAAYVLNRQTGDVTIVDAATGTTIEKVATDGFAVHFLPGVSTALVVDDSVVHAIDMNTNKKLDDLASVKSGDGFSRVEVSPDGKHAVVYGRRLSCASAGRAERQSAISERSGASWTSHSIGAPADEPRRG